MSLLRGLMGGFCAALLVSSSAFAQGAIDVENDPESTTGFSCSTPPIGNGVLLQSFVPEADAVAAVELRFSAGTAFPAGGVTTTVRLRKDSPTGEILGEATADIAGPLTHKDQVRVRFDFAEPVAVTAGASHLIEWVATDSTTLFWVGSNQNPYANGTAYQCFGGVWPGGETDFNFATIAPEPEEEACDPCTLLDGMQVEIDDMAKRCIIRHGTARCLQRKLAYVCKKVQRGRIRQALRTLKFFRWKVRILAWCGHMPRAEAKSLLDGAKEVVMCLRGQP